MIYQTNGSGTRVRHVSTIAQGCDTLIDNVGPGDGVDVSFDATGDLTVHGVTRSITIPLNTKVVGTVIVVAGELNLLLSDYDIAAPQAAIVLTVQDNTDMEFQLFFTK